MLQNFIVISRENVAGLLHQPKCESLKAYVPLLVAKLFLTGLVHEA